jgi:uncharacterized protein (TIGR02588 family)
LHEQPQTQTVLAREQRAQQSPDHAVPVWEWIVAAIGLLLLVGSIGLLSYEALTSDMSPPDITIQIESVQAVTGGYVVTLRVMNSGTATAAAVRVEGVLKRAMTVIETSEMTIDYVPARSERSGGLFFQNDPQQFQREFRALGYQAP